MSKSAEKTGWILLLVFFTIQLALVSWTFPLSELFTDKPLFYSDAAYHWYHMQLSNNLTSMGATAGYDPYFNAGYPGGVTYGWSSKFYSALTLLLAP